MRAGALTASWPEIATWDKAQCGLAWRKLHGSAPPDGLSVAFLRRALVFEAQCKDIGGLSAAVKRQLRSVAGERLKPAGSDAKAAVPTALTVGTQLVREWNGRVYRVLVTEDGFELEGQRFNSLSAIAKRITGAGWSGPRFFGLTKG